MTSEPPGLRDLVNSVEYKPGRHGFAIESLTLRATNVTSSSASTVFESLLPITEMAKTHIALGM